MTICVCIITYGGVDCYGVVDVVVAIGVSDIIDCGVVVYGFDVVRVVRVRVVVGVFVSLLVWLSCVVLRILGVFFAVNCAVGVDVHAAGNNVDNYVDIAVVVVVGYISVCIAVCCCRYLWCSCYFRCVCCYMHCYVCRRYCVCGLCCCCCRRCC